MKGNIEEVYSVSGTRWRVDNWQIDDKQHVVSSQVYKLQVALKSFEKHHADGSAVEKAKLFNVSLTIDWLCATF